MNNSDLIESLTYYNEVSSIAIRNAARKALPARFDNFTLYKKGLEVADTPERKKHAKRALKSAAARVNHALSSLAPMDPRLN